MLTHRTESGTVWKGEKEELSADLDGDYLSSVVVPAFGAGAVRLVTEVVTLRAVVQLRRLQGNVLRAALAHAALG